MKVYKELEDYIKDGRPWSSGILINAIPEYKEMKTPAYVYQGEIYGATGKKLKIGHYGQEYKSIKCGGVNLKVHRVIAWVYCAGHDGRHNEVDHIDGDKGNNHPENLRWVTRWENINYIRNDDNQIKFEL